MNDTCDAVGVWEVDLDLASFVIGYQYPLDRVSKEYAKGVKVLQNNKWWLLDFCSIQYGQLEETSTSKPVQYYIALLKKHTLWKDYTKGIHTLKEKDKEEEKEQAKEQESISEKFERFYKPYPRKEAKGDAEKAFGAIKPDSELVDKMVSKIEIYKKTTDWTKDNGKWIPLPATWLRAKRWEDEIIVNGNSNYKPPHERNDSWHEEDKHL